MRCLICGGRNFTDSDFLFAEMDRIHAETSITLVIEGGQRKWSRVLRRFVGGADYWGKQWAKARGIQVVTVRADWDDLTQPDAVIKTASNGKKYDAMAGPRRNQKMLDVYQPNLCVAFRPGGGGTDDMCGRARKAGVRVIEVPSP